MKIRILAAVAAMSMVAGIVSGCTHNMAGKNNVGVSPTKNVKAGASHKNRPAQ